MTCIILKKGREKSLLRRHPWIFSGAIQNVEGNPDFGETVCILDSHHQFLAWGAYSPASQIRARVWNWNQDTTINESFFIKRLRQAVKARKFWIDSTNTTAYRLVHAESDNLPGLIVDQYDDTLVIQILSAGMERWRDVIISALVDIIQPVCIYERSDVAVRELEGLSKRSCVVYGNLPEQPMIITENGLRFKVNIISGQKTGFFLDQRENRRFSQMITKGKSVLNCFAYTGGFTAYVLSGGASSVLSIDSSEEALNLAQENITLNNLSSEKCQWIVGDVFTELRLLRDKGQQFDLIILDPPKFAPTASQAKKAARGYKDINLYGFKLLKPGGTLMTFSCSGGIDAAFFQKIVADAALDAKVDAQILRRLTQTPDHPTHLAFPEGTYLKGLVVKKL